MDASQRSFISSISSMWRGSSLASTRTGHFSSASGMTLCQGVWCGGGVWGRQAKQGKFAGLRPKISSFSCSADSWRAARRTVVRVACLGALGHERKQARLLSRTGRRHVLGRCHPVSLPPFSPPHVWLV